MQQSETASSAKPTRLHFTSGTVEAGRQELTLSIQTPGRYVLLFESANEPWLQRWIIWDAITLRSNHSILWAIGNEDAPLDYSENAFSEFCDPVMRQDCVTTFIVGQTATSSFAKDLNDGRFPLATVHFDLSKEETAGELRLTISTLYATHTGTDGFAMDVSWQQVQ